MAKDTGIKVIKNSESHYTVRVFDNPTGDYQRIEIIEESDEKRGEIVKQHTLSDVGGIYTPPKGKAKAWCDWIVSNMKNSRDGNKKP